MYIHCSFLHFWNKSFKTNYWIRNYRPNPNWPDLNVSFNVQSWTNGAPLQTPEALVLGNISAGKDVNDSIWVHFLLVNNTTMSKRLKEGLGLNTSFHTQTERKSIYHLRKPGANFLWKVPSAKANQRRCGSLGSKSLVKNTHILQKKKKKRKKPYRYSIFWHAAVSLVGCAVWEGGIPVILQAFMTSERQQFFCGTTIMADDSSMLKAKIAFLTSKFSLLYNSSYVCAILSNYLLSL